MRIFDQMRYASEFTGGLDKTGREYLSLVVKGTFGFPEAGGREVRRAEVQRPLVFADELEGHPETPAVRWETDFAFRKAACDVVAQGAAYAPGGKPAERVRVGLKVGAWSKQFDVVGAREWRVVGPSVGPTRPYPFTRMEFGYHTAFGGVDRLDPEDPTPAACEANPAGIGFASFRNQARLDGQPVANTEEVGRPIVSPYEDYRPMALGPVSRAHPDRRRYAGTYDQAWIDTVFPFLPADFDERYFQMAPPDQQIPKPAPGTEVVIAGMTPEGRVAFRLPEATDLPIRVFRGRETVFHETVRPDTLAFDTEARAMMMTWRIVVPMKRHITEFTEAWIGPPTPAMERALREGRTYIRDVATGPRDES